MQAVISQKGEVHASGRLRKHKELIFSRWHRGAILLPSAPALDSSARSWAPPASPFSKLENRFLYPFLSTYRLFHSLREHYLPWHFQQLHLLIFLARSQLVFVCLLSPSVSVPVVFGLSTPVLLHSCTAALPHTTWKHASVGPVHFYLPCCESPVYRESTASLLAWARQETGLGFFYVRAAASIPCCSYL